MLLTGWRLPALRSLLEKWQFLLRKPHNPQKLRQEGHAWAADPLSEGTEASRALEELTANWLPLHTSSAAGALRGQSKLQGAAGKRHPGPESPSVLLVLPPVGVRRRLCLCATSSMPVYNVCCVSSVRLSVGVLWIDVSVRLSVCVYVRLCETLGVTVKL